MVLLCRSSREAIIFFTTSSGCSVGKKNWYRRDAGCATVENMDVCTCPGSTRVVLMSGHLYLSNASVGSRSLGGNKGSTSHRARSEESHATKSELLWKHNSRLHRGGVGYKPGKGGSRSLTELGNPKHSKHGTDGNLIYSPV